MKFCFRCRMSNQQQTWAIRWNSPYRNILRKIPTDRWLHWNSTNINRADVQFQCRHLENGLMFLRVTDPINHCPPVNLLDHNWCIFHSPEKSFVFLIPFTIFLFLFYFFPFRMTVSIEISTCTPDTGPKHCYVCRLRTFRAMFWVLHKSSTSWTVNVSRRTMKK